MADEWIKLRACLFSGHPVIVRLTEMLDMEDPDFLVGKLARLWVHADQHTVDGLLRFATAETINRIVGYPGFAEAIESVGWGKAEQDGFRIERFEEHNTISTKQRLLATKRAEKYRARTPDRDETNAAVTRGRDETNAAALLICTDLSRARELEGEEELEQDKDIDPQLGGIDSPTEQTQNGPNVVISIEPEPRLDLNVNSESPKHGSAGIEALIANAGERHNGPTPEDFLEQWNNTACVIKARGIKDKRRKAFNVRINEPEWARDYLNALAEIPKSPFLRGENDRGWVANIDWFLDKPSVNKILEGLYAGRGSNSTPGRGDRLAPQPGELKHLENHRVSAEAQRAAAGEAPADGVPF